VKKFEEDAGEELRVCISQKESVKRKKKVLNAKF
jgi:hypothetical protein